MKKRHTNKDKHWKEIVQSVSLIWASLISQWWLGFRAPAASKNTAQWKSGQNWAKIIISLRKFKSVTHSIVPKGIEVSMNAKLRKGKGENDWQGKEIQTETNYYDSEFINRIIQP